MAINQIKIIAQYNANGGSGAPSSNSAQDTFVYQGSQDLTLSLSNTVPTRSGYTFASWNTSSSGSGTNYNPGQHVTRTFTSPSTYTLYLYAKWVQSYTVSYNANGGSGAPSSQTKIYNETLTLSSTIPTRTGYKFNGWNTAANGSGVSYAAGAKYTGNASTTLYAQWSIVPIVPDLTGDGGSSTSTTIGHAMTISLSNPGSISGMTWNLWCTFEGQTRTIATGITSTTYSWTPEASIYNYWIPYNVTHASLKIGATTYVNGTSVGSGSAFIELYASDGLRPVVDSISVEAINPTNTPYGTTVNSWFSGQFIKNVSKIKINYSGSVSAYDTYNASNNKPNYAAKVQSIQLYGDKNSTFSYTAMPSSSSTTISGSKSSGSALTTNTTSETFSAKIKDTRSRESAVRSTNEFTVFNYSYPILTNVSVVRNSSSETRVNISFKSTITNINSGGYNSKKYKVEYRKNGTSSWTGDLITIRNISNYSGTTSVTSGTDIALESYYAWDVKVTIYDDFGSASAIVTVPIVDSILIDVSPTKTISFHKLDPADGKDHWYNNPVMFHNDVYVNGHATKIGYKINSDKTTTTPVSSGTFTAVTNITLAAGTWIITGRIRFPANANGRRSGNISTVSAESAVHVQVPAVSGAITQLAFTKIVSITSSTKYYLNAYQDSGSTLTLPAGSSGSGEINALVAVRIA